MAIFIGVCSGLSAHAAGYGLIVGIDKYDPKYVSPDNYLDGCLHDATGIRYQLLADTSHWTTATCTILTNNAATKTAIRNKLATLASKTVSGDVVVYFQSSHGGTWDEKGTNTYVCTYNDDYQDYELASDLSAFKAGVKVVVIVDACYAAGLFKSASMSTKSAKVKQWNFAQNVTDKMETLRPKGAALSKGATIGWLTACDYNEESWEVEPYGLFAGCLIEGFQNGDADSDGQVTFLELFNYADSLTRAASEKYGQEQDPQVLNTSMLGATVARDLSVQNNALTLSNAVDSTSLTWTTGGDADWFGQTDVSYDGVSAARSGIITDDSTSWLQTAVTGPGILRFKWKVSSEKSYDDLKFYLDNVLQGTGISGEQGWALQQYSLASGTHTLRWVFTKDDTEYGGNDCGWLDQVEWLSAHTVTLDAQGGTVSPSALVVYNGLSYGALPTPVRNGYFFNGWWTGENGAGARIKNNTLVSDTSDQTLYANWVTTVSLADALDETNCVWKTGAGTNWVGIASSGYNGDTDAARTGILTNRAQSWLQTTLTGPVTLSYWWRVSSSNGYDYLSFLIDDAEQAGKISGETDWAQKSYPLSAGAHTVKWVYTKKTTVGQGEDCGWLDQVTVDCGSVCFSQNSYTTSGEGDTSTGGVNAVVAVYGAGPVSATVTAVPGSATVSDFSSTVSGSNLTWAAGESGVKYVTVSIKGDKLAESNEVFYLVLGNARGGTITEPSICAVVIADDDSGSVANKGVYISGAPTPSEGGSVSGGGYCLSGKSVKVTATAKSGWTFTAWESGSQFAVRTVAWAEAVAVAQNGAMLCRAIFKRTSEIDPPATSNPGNRSATVGVAYQMTLPVVSESWPTVKISGLPAGLRLDATASRIVGVPTTAGTFGVTFTASNAAGTGFSQTFVLTVGALPAWAQGTFNGVCVVPGLETPGLAFLTVTSLGKISGKLTSGGTNYAFSAGSYTNGDGFAFGATATAGKVAIPLYVAVTQAVDSVATNLGVAYSTDAVGGEPVAASYRNVWKDAGMTSVATNYAGYYTATLPGSSDYGSGYLAFTVDKAGGVKTTGKLADGTALSLGGTLILDESGRVWTVLCTAPSAYKGGGLYGIAEFVKTETGPVTVRLLEVPFQWQNLNPQATGEYGVRFSRELDISGGWYSTVINLRSYYESGLAIGGVVLPAIAAVTKYTDWNDDGTKKIAWSETNQVGAVEGASPNGVVLTVTPATGVGAGFSASKTDMTVKDAETGEYVYADTTGDGTNNTAGLTFTFTRATGLFKGTFKTWYDYVSAQDNTTGSQTLTHTFKTSSFEGALTPVRESGEAEGRGFFLWADKSSFDSGKVDKYGNPILTPYSFNGSYDFLLLGN